MCAAALMESSKCCGKLSDMVFVVGQFRHGLNSLVHKPLALFDAYLWLIKLLQTIAMPPFKAKHISGSVYFRISENPGWDSRLIMTWRKRGISKRYFDEGGHLAKGKSIEVP